MKFKIFIFFVFCIALFSCKDDDAARLQANAKETQKNEEVFKTINKAWVFNQVAPSVAVQKHIQNWSEWRLFINELNQKPKSSIGAFQQKARTLSLKVSDLQNHIPSGFDKPEIISRIMTLSTKIKSLNLYINLSYIQDQKVVKLIPEINEELASLVSQMEEIVIKSNIKLEEGEAEMLHSIATDSIKKPQEQMQGQPINLQQRKPSSNRENAEIIPTLDPKRKRQ
jgi:ElaB/YqjD/DUF883 family membrane-anchored ribosome-binding protein